MQIVGRTHCFLVSVYGSRWKEIYLSFFVAHIDDSGTDPQQKVASATALIIPAARILALESEWEKLKKKECFSEWHTSEFVARNPDSDFANWDKVKGDRVFRRVREVCMKYGVQAMSFTVNKSDYDEVMPDVMRPYAGRFHYTWAIRNTLNHLENWRLTHGAEHPLEYIFDWMGEKRKNPRRQEIEDVMDQAEEDAIDKGRAGEFSHWTFRHRKEIPGLQCVDALAWCVYQAGLVRFCGRTLPKEAGTAWDDFCAHNGGTWGFDVIITREHLKEWVDKELADGRALARFQERERKKSEKVTGVRELRSNNANADTCATQQDKGTVGRGEKSKKAKA